MDDKAATRSVRSILLQGASSAFLVRCAAVVLTMGVHVSLARILGPGEYGVYAYVVSWLVFLVFFSSFGLDNSSVRYVPQYRVRGEWSLLRGLLRSSDRLVLLVAFGVALTTGLVLFCLRKRLDPRLLGTFWVGCLVVPVLASVNVRSAVLRAFRFTFMGLALRQVLYPAFLIVLVFIVHGLLPVELDSRLAMGLNLAAVCLVWLCASVTLRRRLPGAARAGPEDYHRREWLLTSSSLMVFSGLNLISVRSDVIMIGMFRGTEEAGVYVAAVQVASLISFALFSANAILAPMISELYHAGRLGDLQRMLRWAACGIALCCVPLGLVLLFLGSRLLGWWGPSFVQGQGALNLLILGWLVNALAGPVGFMMTMTGEHRRASVVSAVAACLNIVLNAILVPRFGILGAAVATTVTFSGWNCALYVMVLRIHGINPGMLFLFRPRPRFASAGRSDARLPSLVKAAGESRS